MTDSEQVAIVTGAGSASGIGYATARGLATAGFRLMIAATTDRIEDRATELRGHGAQVEAFVGDLTDSSVATALAAAAIDTFGRVDALVNNAGMTSVSVPAVETTLETTSDEQWRAAISRNLDTMFYVTRAVLPVMRAAKHGRIVNVGSVSGPVVAFAGAPGYHAAKAGVLGLTRSVALEAARDGITVNTVAPGWIETESSTEDELRHGRATPVGRPGTPAEVASLICWLAGRSSSYVTGQLFVVDGGNSVVEGHVVEGHVVEGHG